VTSSPAGINCGSDCSETYDNNTVVTLTASASTGSTFTGWSGACTNSTGTCQVTMTAARSVTANFTLNTYILTVFKTGGRRHADQSTIRHRLRLELLRELQLQHCGDPDSDRFHGLDLHGMEWRLH
jgi:uncharacterized repeat protein (TIGR02543 family)